MFTIICIAVLVQSCGKSYYILKYQPIALTQEEKTRRSNNLMVFDVTDNRPIKSDTLGYKFKFDSKKTIPVIYNYPLNEMVKNGLNRYLYDSSFSNELTKVNVEINRFEASPKIAKGKKSSMLRYSFYFKFSEDNKHHTFFIEDSSSTEKFTDSAFSISIDKSLSHIVGKFLYYYEHHKHDSTKQKLKLNNSTLSTKRFDMMDASAYKYKDTVPLSWITLQKLSGAYSIDGYNVAYEVVLPGNDSKWSYAYDAFFEYVESNSGKTVQYENYNTLGYIGSSVIFRYSLSPFYLSGAVSIFSGSELRESDDQHFIIGAKLSQQAGMVIFKHVRISGGLFQIGILNSKIYPKDYGFHVSLGVGF